MPRSSTSFEEGKNPDRAMLTARLLEWLQKPVASAMEVCVLAVVSVGLAGCGVEVAVCDYRRCSWECRWQLPPSVARDRVIACMEGIVGT